MLVPRIEAEGEVEAGESLAERWMDRLLSGGLGAAAELLAFEPAELLALMPVQITIE